MDRSNSIKEEKYGNMKREGKKMRACHFFTL